MLKQPETTAPEDPVMAETMQDILDLYRSAKSSYTGETFEEVRARIDPRR
jgi:hypothetical protein